MSLVLCVGELQRVTGQLEEAVTERVEYSAAERERIASELRELVVRIELARCEIVDPEAATT